MSNEQSFELLPILSLLNKQQYLDVKKEDIHAIVEYVVGESLTQEQYEQVHDQVIDHIAEHHPRLVEAASIVSINTNFTLKHYNTTINLYRKNHLLKKMETVEA